jgi:hypothetical protein
MTVVELLQGWNGNAAGMVLRLEMDGVALALIERGIAKQVEKPKRPKKLQEWVRQPEE